LFWPVAIASVRKSSVPAVSCVQKSAADIDRPCLCHRATGSLICLAACWFGRHGPRERSWFPCDWFCSLALAVWGTLCAADELWKIVNFACSFARKLNETRGNLQISEFGILSYVYRIISWHGFWSSLAPTAIGQRDLITPKQFWRQTKE
jgi:hypothetical protein